MDYQPKHGPVCVEMGFVEEGEEDYLYSRVWTEQGKEFKKTKLSDVDKSWWRAMFNMKPSDSELLVAVDETFEDKFELQKVDITQNLLTQLRAIKRAVVDKKTYKVGIIYCADGQTEQTDILDNQEGSEAYGRWLCFPNFALFSSRKKEEKKELPDFFFNGWKRETKRDCVRVWTTSIALLRRTDRELEQECT
eukprot:TRINITY_DN1778_c1_g1_i2.p2 TRINITY_DN1778_c1_g1~~TRINITY_DN1778_c1_g1_i2.p2  ORF type:complete len:193 (+),score=37.24 TRINITY_DN1778_c1_g1_i2:175-753(+)